MGIADIVGFAVCWVFAAAVLTWGVLSERRRNGCGRDRVPKSRRRGAGVGGFLRPRPRVWRRRVAGVQVPPPARVEQPRRPGPGSALPRPVPARVGSARWVVVESLAGSGPEVRAQGELLFAAALAARGVETSELRPGDRRVEVTYPDEGGEVTVFLLRSGVLTPAEPA
jgi:hypothetical protein